MDKKRRFRSKRTMKKLIYFKLKEHKCIRYTVIKLSLAKKTDWRTYNGNALYT